MVNPIGPSSTELTALRAASVGRQAAAAAAPQIPQTTLQAIGNAACNAASTVASAFAHLGTAIQTRMHPSAPALPVTSANSSVPGEHASESEGIQLQVIHPKATMAELSSTPLSELAAVAARALHGEAVIAGSAAAEARTSDPRESATNAAAAAVAATAIGDEVPLAVTTPAPAGNFLTRFFSACTARLFTGSAQVQPAPVAETPPTIEQLLNGQHAANLKTKGFMLGSFGYGFFKTFSVLANAETKTLIGRISALETGAAEVQKAANKVAKALSNGDVCLEGIRGKQEKLAETYPTLKTAQANKVLTQSIHELMLMADRFANARQDKDLPIEGGLLHDHTAYTQVLGKLIQNNKVGIKLTDEAIEAISDLNFIGGSTLRNEVNTFAKAVDEALNEALKENGAALPSLDNLITLLKESLGKTEDQKAFIEARVLKKLGCDSLGLLNKTDKNGTLIPGKLQQIAETNPATMAIPALRQEAEGIHETINSFAVEISRLQNIQSCEREVKGARRLAFINALLAHIEKAVANGKIISDADHQLYTDFKQNKLSEDLNLLERLAESMHVGVVSLLEPTLPDESLQLTWKAVEEAHQAHEAAKKAVEAAETAYKNEVVSVFGQMPSHVDIFEKDGGKVTGFKIEHDAAGEQKGTALAVFSLAKPNSKLAVEINKLNTIDTVRDPAIREAFAKKQVAARALFERIMSFKQAIADHKGQAFKVADLLPQGGDDASRGSWTPRSGGSEDSRPSGHGDDGFPGGVRTSLEPVLSDILSPVPAPAPEAQAERQPMTLAEAVAGLNALIRDLIARHGL